MSDAIEKHCLAPIIDNLSIIHISKFEYGRFSTPETNQDNHLSKLKQNNPHLIHRFKSLSKLLIYQFLSDNSKNVRI